jgi:hypothetical protein
LAQAVKLLSCVLKIVYIVGPGVNDSDEIAYIEVQAVMFLSYVPEVA